MESIWNFLNHPRRLTGLFGITFVLLFIVSGPILQGASPVFGDSAEEIRAYWTEEAEQYLAGEFLFIANVMLMFLPFLAGLRTILLTADRSGGLWATIALAGGIAGFALGGAGALGPAALAFGDIDAYDDSVLLFATATSSYAIVLLSMGFAVMLLSASVVILQSGVAWKWLGLLGPAIAACLIIGAAWIINADLESPLGLIHGIGLITTQLWILLVSVCFVLPVKNADDSAERSN